ncbi:hypothetical protein BB559_002476 [Furculomyces boomerangus]|uniref:MutL C-terminal dimerisation domain-containing protein n=1 Tax=Furculomyces boomerangus TaxID=61424 RepID=A0A2T9YUZ5_9FUNG|nr:hypothetical protein BB559_002476 [Furculomyces boomerangus]
MNKSFKRNKTLQKETQDLLIAGFTFPSISDCVCESLENAIQAGSTTISVEIDNPKLFLKISDNGTGIDYFDLVKLQENQHATNPKQITTYYGPVDLKKRISQVYGIGMSKSMDFLFHECDGYSIKGLMSTRPLFNGIRILSINKNIFSSEKISNFLEDLVSVSEYGKSYELPILGINLDEDSSDNQESFQRIAGKKLSYVLTIECDESKYVLGSRSNIRFDGEPEFRNWKKIYKLFGYMTIKFLKKYSLISFEKIPLLTNLILNNGIKSVSPYSKVLTKKTKTSDNQEKVVGKVFGNYPIHPTGNCGTQKFSNILSKQETNGISEFIKEDKYQKLTLEQLYNKWNNPVYPIGNHFHQSQITKHPGRYQIPNRITTTLLQSLNFTKKTLDNIRVIGQLDKKFILCKPINCISKDTENPSTQQIDLIAIDQHAADERVGLENIINQYYEAVLNLARSQLLSLPYPLDSTDYKIPNFSHEEFTNSNEPQPNNHSSFRTNTDSNHEHMFSSCCETKVDSSFNEKKPINTMQESCSQTTETTGIVHLSEPIFLTFDSVVSELIITYLSALKAWGFDMILYSYNPKLSIKEKDYFSDMDTKFPGDSKTTNTGEDRECTYNHYDNDYNRNHSKSSTFLLLSVPVGLRANLFSLPLKLMRLCHFGKQTLTQHDLGLTCLGFAPHH